MKLYHKRYGTEGKRIIILHGLFGMSDNWHFISQQLSAEYQLVVPDQRNHGSSPHSDEMSYTLMADDIKELLDELGWEKAHIIGHSMGGKVAMNFALQYPGKTEKLLVADIAPKQYHRGHDDIFDALFSIDLESFETRGQIDQYLQPKLPDFGTRQFILKNLGRNEQGKFYWKMNVQGIYDNYDKIISAALPEGRQYAGETLFIKGDRSRYIKEGDETLIRQFFPRAEIHTIHNSGHWVHAENPAQVIEEIKNFI